MPTGYTAHTYTHTHTHVYTGVRTQIDEKAQPRVEQFSTSVFVFALPTLGQPSRRSRLLVREERGCDSNWRKREEKRSRGGRGTTSCRQEERGGPPRVLMRMSEINPPPAPFRFPSIHLLLLSFSHTFPLHLCFLSTFSPRATCLSSFPLLSPILRNVSSTLLSL